MLWGYRASILTKAPSIEAFLFGGTLKPIAMDVKKVSKPTDECVILVETAGVGLRRGYLGLRRPLTGLTYRGSKYSQPRATMVGLDRAMVLSREEAERLAAEIGKDLSNVTLKVVKRADQ